MQNAFVKYLLFLKRIQKEQNKAENRFEKKVNKIKKKLLKE